ncbi:MotA/TolQ/ExbB proton channel family protein [Planctomycetes bacterium K2D]|uniref:MotA/TolQ/ExbB proton channel family protein n=2 Tax=Botrimarina mediterranea TaxID=2528022 RepID=A0A518K9D2_9BACT|nr:MotA/TolQ/ExbB proton channel family protein [Botrimarina mediterranea]QDV79001.1 MotA/TolQ/ExbB proton channel family protein [Planctomycetes bacterium K2D]
MPPITSIANWLLRLPLLWGGLATLAFYAAMQGGMIGSPILARYCALHPVEVTSMLLFFVAMAALAIRLTAVLAHLGATRVEPLGPTPAEGQSVGEAPQLLAKLDSLSGPLQRTPLVRRLRAALGYVVNVGSGDTLESHLEHLAQVDRDKAAAGYTLPKLMRAMLPIVGMLGTIVGITMAIAQLSPESLEESLDQVMASLAVAFDTTAQAMVLMLITWFGVYVVESTEERLLDEVDRVTAKQLIGRFQQFGSQKDPNVAAIRRMSEQVIESVEQLTHSQALTWQILMDDMQERWLNATSSAGELLTTTLANGLREGLKDHATGLTSGVELQLNSLAQSLNKQQSLVADAVKTQLVSLERLQKEHAQRLHETSEVQTGRLVTSADGLLGNLRDGLERMAELLVEALQKHGETLTEAENELASENRRHLSEVEAAMGEAMVIAADRQEKLVRQSEAVLREMQQALVSAAGATIDQQKELVKQGEVLLKVVDSTGHVQRLEETLNRNLSSLGRAHNFEETLMNLSAAIQLLSARVGRESSAPKAITPSPSTVQQHKAA